MKHHHSKGLRFRARCTRAASWTLPKRCQCHAGTAPLQARKLPFSEPRDEITSIYPGVDTASFYLWVRADGRGTARRECSGTALRPIAAVEASGEVGCTALDLQSCPNGNAVAPQVECIAVWHQLVPAMGVEGRGLRKTLGSFATGDLP